MFFKHCEQFDDRSPFQKAFLSCLFSTSTATFILTMTFLKVKVRSQKMILKTKEKFCSSAWLISTLINDNQGWLLRRWDLLGFVLVLLELLLPWTLGPSSVAILKVLLQTVTVSSSHTVVFYKSSVLLSCNCSFSNITRLCYKKPFCPYLIQVNFD